MNKDALYLKLPIMLQNAAVSAYGMYINAKRYNKDYDKLERRISNNLSLSLDELNGIQLNRLTETLKFAQTHVPYYKKLFRELNFSWLDVKSLNDLSLLPVLNKQTVRQNVQDFYPDNLSSMSYAMVNTSGTTGTSLSFPLTIDAEREQWAVCWRYRKQFNLYRGVWYAHFYGKSIVPVEQKEPPFWRINYSGKQIFFSAYHMNESNLSDYVDALNAMKPPWIQGYPSLLTLLSDFMLSEKLHLAYKPLAITIGSESLLEHQRDKIKRAFGVDCKQHYGMTEAVANISECSHGKLHVDEDFGYVEFMDNGNGHDILSTGFANKGFVLIRYSLGDTVNLPNEAETCQCGNNGRIVNSIDGRKEDYVVLPDGTKIGRLDHIVKNAREIKECQIYQPALGKIIFRVVKSGGYQQKDESQLISEARKRLGDKLDIEVQYHSNLVRSKTGKLRFVVSDIDVTNNNPI